MRELGQLEASRVSRELEAQLKIRQCGWARVRLLCEHALHLFLPLFSFPSPSGTGSRLSASARSLGIGCEIEAAADFPGISEDQTQPQPTCFVPQS